VFRGISKTPDKMYVEEVLEDDVRMDGEPTISFHRIGHEWKHDVSKTTKGLQYLQKYVISVIACADDIITGVEKTLPPVEEMAPHHTLTLNGRRMGVMTAGGHFGSTYILPQCAAEGKGHFVLHRFNTDGLEETLKSYGVIPFTEYLRRHQLGFPHRDLASAMATPEGYTEMFRLQVITKNPHKDSPEFRGRLVIRSACDDESYWMLYPGETLKKAVERADYKIHQLPNLLARSYPSLTIRDGVETRSIRHRREIAEASSRIPVGIETRSMRKARAIAEAAASFTD
jgi:hypothetical protein